MTMFLSPLNHRHQFPAYLNKLGLVGTAVEVGSHRGEFAFYFREHWRGALLVCVDPWACPPGYEHQQSLLADSSGDRGEDYLAFRERMKEHLDRGSVTQMRCCSDTAAHGIPLESLDFVYIDGDHRYESVCADLTLWYDRLKPGGVLAGHDFICPGEQEVGGEGWGKEIQPAVLEFADLHDLDVYLIPENAPETAGQPWSFYMRKTS